MDIMNSIKYSIEKLSKLKDQTIVEINGFEIELEEYYLFENKIRTSLYKKFITKKAQYQMQSLLLDEFSKIKMAEIAHTSELENVLSPYGSLYCGTDIIYYDERLSNYNDEQIFQIICNHIFHYLLGLHIYNRDNNIQLSNILLAFGHTGLTSQSILYSRSKRNVLNLKYTNEMKNIIIFCINENFSKFFLKNKIENKYCQLYKHPIGGDMIMTKYLDISQGACRFPICNYIIIKNFLRKTSSNVITRDNIHSEMLTNDNCIRRQYYEFNNKNKKVSGLYEQIKRIIITW